MGFRAIAPLYQTSTDIQFGSAFRSSAGQDEQILATGPFRLLWAILSGNAEIRGDPSAISSIVLSWYLATGSGQILYQARRLPAATGAREAISVGPIQIVLPVKGLLIPEGEVLIVAATVNVVAGSPAGVHVGTEVTWYRSEA